LFVLLLASSCGTKPAENTAAAANTAATNQPATPTPAPAAADASKAPVFDAEPTSTDDVLIFAEVMDIGKDVTTGQINPHATISNNIAIAPFAGQQLDNIAGDVMVYTLKDGGKYVTAEITLNKIKARKITLRNDKMEQCTCGDVAAQGKIANGTFFYFSTAKNKWVVMKPKENIPSAEVQKQMFEECLAQAEIIKEFAKTAKAPTVK
jgi:hypothetical protein